jgi:feruloyl esterase
VAAFCRVKGTTSPVPGSSIAFEVWLPASWNGKLMGIGNSGANGEISYTLSDASLASAVNRGYAAAGTDTGHVSSPVNGTWAVGAPEKILDNASRSIVEVTAKAKAIIAARYGEGPGLSYFFGCSMGGRQGLLQAQRFPDAYDGIIAGAPVLDLPSLTAAGVFQAQQLAGPGFFPASKLPAIAAAVRAECDASDGLVDGLIDDPRECDWDPADLICAGPETPACLTKAQAKALNQIYKGPRRADTNEKIYPGLERGGEDGFGPLGWARAVTGPPAPGLPDGTPGIGALLASAYINHVAFQSLDPLFKTFTFDFAGDLDFVTAELADLYNADDPDLSAFRARGGKILMYHGWSDPILPPRASVDYYKSVRKEIGSGNTKNLLRLFMAPGMEHCVGGTGPFLFDAVGPLEQWVEQGIAPERIDALHVNLATGTPTRTRPLCPFPSVARYDGSGSIDDAANFNCEEPD